jgi:hypothetical protein
MKIVRRSRCSEVSPSGTNLALRAPVALFATDSCTRVEGSPSSSSSSDVSAASGAEERSEAETAGFPIFSGEGREGVSWASLADVSSTAEDRRPPFGLEALEPFRVLVRISGAAGGAGSFVAASRAARDRFDDEEAPASWSSFARRLRFDAFASTPSASDRVNVPLTLLAVAYETRAQRAHTVVSREHTHGIAENCIQAIVHRGRGGFLLALLLDADVLGNST